MTKEEFKNLKCGDIVRLSGKPDSYVVQYPTKNGYIVIRMMEATMHSEWVLAVKNGERRRTDRDG